MKTRDLVRKLDAVRSQGESSYSNIYRSIASLPEQEWECRTSEKTVCISYFEGGAQRSWFLTSDLDDLVKMLREMPKGLVMDIISRGSSYLSEPLARGGFHSIARMQRWANRDISVVLDGASVMVKRYGGSHPGIAAHEDDAGEILAIYTQAFDSRVSHLPSLEKLRMAIRAGDVIIHKEDGRIRTILQRNVEPKRFYIHQVYNDGAKAWLHGLLLAELQKYYTQGGRYLYAWVQDTNIASQKMHAKYGMLPDGLWDIVYAKK